LSNPLFRAKATAAVIVEALLMSGPNRVMPKPCEWLRPFNTKGTGGVEGPLVWDYMIKSCAKVQLSLSGKLLSDPLRPCTTQFPQGPPKATPHFLKRRKSTLNRKIQYSFLFATLRIG